MLVESYRPNQNKSCPRSNLRFLRKVGFIEKILNFLEPLPKSESIAAKSIQDLSSTLEKLPNVFKVEPVCIVPGDLHRVNFELTIRENAENVEDVWDKAETIAMLTHRELRKATGEKWYFHTEII